jgi:cilia- and flagella-associated protein 44
VLSGSQWGNILVWDGGSIKIEVCRKGRKPCHSAPITQILMQNGQDVITVGQDGHVRIWFWETVELADPPEDDRVVEIEPIYEYKIGNSLLTTQLMGMVKMTERTDNYKW